MTDERVEIREGASYVDYQTDMVKLANNFARIVQDIVGKAGTNEAELGQLANQLTRDFELLARELGGAARTSTYRDVDRRIRMTVQDLDMSCKELVQEAGSLQSNPADSFARRNLTEHARSVTGKVSFVLATLQSVSRGTQACSNAAHTVSGIIADLDTTIIFATAGTLNADGDSSFADHRENILKTAYALKDDTKILFAAFAQNQEALVLPFVQMAVKTITRLADVVKFGAGSLGSDQSEAQVLLISAVKDVASALSDLISATKNASGKNVLNPAMEHLKDSAKVMVTNVKSLLKTVKSVEDEATRGTRALESTIKAIGQEIKDDVNVLAEGTVTPMRGDAPISTQIQKDKARLWTQIQKGKARFFADRQLGQPDTEYKMDYPKRGKAIIINNKDFDSSNMREGTDVDAKNLGKLFKDMGFELDRHDNLTSEGMRDALSKASQDAAFNSQADCFICTILTHGCEDIVIGIDEEPIKVQVLLDLFRGDSCKSLCGKPKIFFIQACRGDKTDIGVQTDGEGIPDTHVYKIPIHADFLIAYSTVQGYSSFRDTKDGSWFVQALCKILTNHWKEQDLLTMMTQVNMEVAKFETGRGYKEMSSEVSMLRKKIQFT